MALSSHRRGFTLIELLVVIAIIAILAAILFPVFARAREKARQTTCSSNQRQIAASIQMYVQDHDETFPAASTIWRDVNLDPGVLICPTLGKGTPNGYVYNNSYSGVAIGTVADPTTASLTMDGIGQNVAATGYYDAMYAGVVYTPDQQDLRHTNKIIVSYVDGHVGVQSEGPSDLSGTPFVAGAPLFPSGKDVNMSQMPATTWSSGGVGSGSGAVNGGSAANMGVFCQSSAYIQWAAGSLPAYLQATLPTMQKVYRVRIENWSGQRPGSGSIYVVNNLSDIGNVSPVYTFSGNTAQKFDVTFTPKYGKYVRLVVNTATDAYATIEMMDIFTMDNKLIDGTYPVSGNASGNCTLTNDGNWAAWDGQQVADAKYMNYEMRYSEYNTGDCYPRPAIKNLTTGTMKFTFPQTYKFTKAMYSVYGGTLSPTNVTISLSPDDVTYTQVYSGTPSGNLITATFAPANFAAKYAKYTATGPANGGTNYSGINPRVAFFGAP